MNLEKVVFGFFILLAATLNFGFVYGDIGNPDQHNGWELFGDHRQSHRRYSEVRRSHPYRSRSLGFEPRCASLAFRGGDRVVSFATQNPPQLL